MKAALTVALILDALSPNASNWPKNLQGESHKVAVYPLRAKDPERDRNSSCSYVIEKFLPAQELGTWMKTWEPQKNADLPVAQAIRKVQFDLEYDLHQIDRLIIDAPVGEKDSCGQLVCRALLDLRHTIEKKRAHLRIESVHPLSCASLSSARVQVSTVPGAALSAKGLPPAQGAVTSILSPQTSIEIGKGTLEIVGPPLSLELREVGGQARAIHANSPQKVELAAGAWKVGILSPPWAQSVPAAEVKVVAGEAVTLSLLAAFGENVEWIKSDGKVDQMILIGHAPSITRILLPAKSPSVPVPKGLGWSVFQQRGDKESSP